MQALDEQLVRRCRASHHAAHAAVRSRRRTIPGYIKGYLPGVRENGAQYTHAALWAVMATALRGDGDRAFELFQMLNPLTHAATAAEAATYKVEPYVVAADVYTAPSQLGRGGWTWYTGVGELDVPRRARDDPRLHQARQHAADRAAASRRPGASTDQLSLRRVDVRHHRARSARGPAPRRGACASTESLAADGIIPLVDDGGRHVVVVDTPLTSAP